MSARVEQIHRDGYAMVPQVFSAEEVQRWAVELEHAILADEQYQAAISRGSTVVAARNVLEVYPLAKSLWRRQPLQEVLSVALGPRFGLVRGLFFDKPPEKSWSLPWHQDRAIAVKNNRLPSAVFGKPTTKAGVPHVEAPLWLSEQMLLARIHLDPMLDENGPLQVIPKSHLQESISEGEKVVTLNAQAGDVLLMRPLLFHRSGESHPGTKLHRRILHLEFNGSAELPDGYAWQTYVPGEVW